MAEAATTRLPTNGEVAERLELIADLLEIEGAVRHRVMAYRRGAARVRAASVGAAELSLAGRAVELPDIGPTLQAKIAEFAETGDMEALARLRARVPPGLALVARLEGIGPKRAKALWSELGIETVAELREAIAAGRLTAAPGFGPKTAAALAAQLAALAEGGEPKRRMSMGRAQAIAEALADGLRRVPGVREVAVAGSVRRGVEEVGDIDIVAAVDEDGPIADALAAHPSTAEVLTRGPGGSSVMTHAGIRVELRVGPPESFGNLMQHTTGSGPHNVRLRELAVRRGLSMSQHGIKDADGHVVTHAREEDVYGALGLPLIPPELREDRGEIDLAARGELPELVEERDLRGDLHAHTSWSDGKASLAAMVAGAVERGYEYLAISDHSQSLAMAGGLDRERVLRQWEEIEALRERHPATRILKACEMDILADGSLDFEDELLAGFDFVTASVHSAMRQSERELTARLLAAIESPHVDCIGHPTGRMFGRRESYPIDLDRVAERAAATGTFLEINSQPHRLDLNDRMARVALDAGVCLTIGSDAHSVEGLDMRRFGVAVARRAGARAEDIVTTRAWDQVLALRGAVG